MTVEPQRVLDDLPTRRQAADWGDGTRPIHRALVDVRAFEEDPRTALAASPIVFWAGFPVEMYIIVGVLSVIIGLWSGLPMYVPVGLSFLAVSFVWWRSGEIRCDAFGLHFVRGRSMVSCPWALFSVPPTASAPRGDRSSWRCVLPVDVRQLDRVEHWKNGRLVGPGADKRSTPVRFSRDGAIASVQGLFRVQYDVLAVFLNRLALVMADEVEVKRPVVHETVMPLHEPNDWVLIRLNHFEMPECCARCSRPATTEVELVRKGMGMGLLVSMLGLGGEAAAILFPVCRECWRRTVALRAASIAVLVVAVGLAILPMTIGTLAIPEFLLVAGCVALAFAARPGWLLGTRLADIARLRRYRPLDETIEIKTRSAVFLAQLEASERRDRAE